MKTELTDEQLAEVKAWKPDWFKPVYKDNTWYKNTKRNSIMFNVKDGHGYGINHYGEWIKDAAWLANYPENGEWREATKQETEEALMDEANKRYRIGDSIRSISPEYKEHSIEKVCYNCGITKNVWFVTCMAPEKEWKLKCSNPYLFFDGKWAKVITSSSDIHNDIQALKDKYIDYNITIIAEKKWKKYGKI